MEKKFLLVIPIVVSFVGCCFTSVPFWFWSASPEVEYQVKEIEQYDPGDIDESFTITGQKQAAGFSQKLVTWSGAEEQILLDVSIDQNQILLRETYTSVQTTGNRSLYVITGDITHLQPGTYTVKVFWTVKARNQTDLLFTDSISVERKGINWVYVIVPGIITGTITATTMYLILRKEKKSN